MSEDNGPYAARLAAERRATTERLEALQREFDAVVVASEGANADDEHDPEGATIAYERSQLASLITRARRRLAEIAAAEDRLRDGGYGRCIVCGRPIPEARLEARPVARTCVNCG